MNLATNKKRYGLLGIYLLIIVSTTAIQWIYTIQLNTSFWSISGLLRSIGDATLFTLPAAIGLAVAQHRVRRSLITITLLLHSFFHLCLLLYFRTYGSLMPFSSWSLIENLPIVFPSAIASIRIQDLVFLLLPILPIEVLRRLRSAGKRLLIPTIASAVSASVLLHLSTDIRFEQQKDGSHSSNHPYSIFHDDPLRIVPQYGILWQLRAELYDRSKQITPEDKKTVDHFLQSIQSTTFPSQTVDTIERKNLIVLIIESMGSWTNGLIIDGYPITPTLDSLRTQSSCHYFPHTMPQVKGGRSSDAQLILNSGLLPQYIGATCFARMKNHIPSLPKELKKQGYHSFNFICDNREVWNQATLSQALGFDTLIDTRNHLPHENRYLTDRELFAKNIPYLAQQQQPFYAQFITIDSHTPYSTPIDPHSPLCHTTLTTEIRNYLIAINHVDKQIKYALDLFNKYNLLENTTLLILADHESIAANEYTQSQAQTTNDILIPLYILNSPIEKADTPLHIGQIDIYPTILQMMRIDKPLFNGLGTSIYNQHPNFTTHFHYDPIGYTNNDSIRRQRTEQWKIADIIWKSDWFKLHLQKTK